MIVASIDQGTSSTKLCLFQLNETNVLLREPFFKSSCPVSTLSLDPDKAEMCPLELMASVNSCISQCPVMPDRVAITNQRESILAWDLKTGKPVSNIIRN